MIFKKSRNALQFRLTEELVWIEAWGKNALRVRATKNAALTKDGKGLSETPHSSADISISPRHAEIGNGLLRCVVGEQGDLRFYKDNKSILREYYRAGKDLNEHSRCLKFSAREHHSLGGNEYAVTARFESVREEKIYGMGQYQQSDFNLKGCVLELAQRNSQISIPFYLSSLGYGFLWNHPGTGEVAFGQNYTQWKADLADELDYLVIAGDTPKEILQSYTAVTGRPPAFPDNALGLWQCKLRYRTQEEVLSVAREYRRRGIPLDVIVIDFFHWTEQGEWKFNPEWFPDPKSMMDELRAMGTRCMVSVWPTVHPNSENYRAMRDRNLLVRSEQGLNFTMPWRNGACCFFDATNPEAQKFVWSKLEKNYVGYGIDMFWLDEAEPEFMRYDYDHYRYYAGNTAKVAGYYPRGYAKALWDGQNKRGQTDIVNLARCAWVGSQKYGAVIWSGDVQSSFTSFRDQVTAGLHMGLTGQAWWTTDIGGFYQGNVENPEFRELLIRWYQYAVFSPVLRMHGDRLPKSKDTIGFAHTGAPNELWSYGEDVFNILRQWLDIRLSIKDYIAALYREASENGSPLMRTMFYEFPEDTVCWEIEDQYMFGSRYLVAPVLYYQVRERAVYLPAGQWKNIHSGQVYDGRQTVTVDAPLSLMPVFEKL